MFGSPLSLRDPGGAASSSASGGSTSRWFGASEFIPRVTNGPGVNSSETTTHDFNYDTLDFDAATSEGATLTWAMPNNWNLGTITAIVVFTNDSGSGTVTWRVSAACPVDGEAIDTALGTAQSVTKTCGDPLDWNFTAATPAITVGGTPSTSAPIKLLIERDVADTLGVDARLIGVILFWTAA